MNIILVSNTKSEKYMVSIFAFILETEGLKRIMYVFVKKGKKEMVDDHLNGDIPLIAPDRNV